MPRRAGGLSTSIGSDIQFIAIHCLTRDTRIGSPIFLLVSFTRSIDSIERLERLSSRSSTQTVFDRALNRTKLANLEFISYIVFWRFVIAQPLIDVWFRCFRYFIYCSFINVSDINYIFLLILWIPLYLALDIYLLW